MPPSSRTNELDARAGRPSRVGAFVLVCISIAGKLFLFAFAGGAIIALVRTCRPTMSAAKAVLAPGRRLAQTGFTAFPVVVATSALNALILAVLALKSAFEVASASEPLEINTGNPDAPLLAREGMATDSSESPQRATRLQHRGGRPTKKEGRR